ncbi:hypothetical protein L1987_80626 [Smallanthus sonchifolius]|uniref:Uncharacterized protein n=1 Tax=Smallanthus sonchifolius TaxID=185202 RepID=A0ACB8YPA9_9ASTR|nr:hypothetical protein L1987_80626 [Smallanthus sonchifolius]
MELSPEYEKAASVLSSNDPLVTLAKVDANDEKNKDLATEYEIKSFPTLKIIKNGGKTIKDYKGPRDAQGIVAYLKKQSRPASTEIKSTEDGSDLVDGDKIVIAMLFVNFSSKPFGAFESKYHAIANEQKGKGISFLMGDVEAPQGAFQFFGLKEDHVPVIVINNDKEKYVKPNLEPDHIESWLKEYKDGKIAPYVKSEPVPESNNQPIKDATANDIVHEGFEIKGYPTLYFKSASGNLLKYSGKRTKEKISDFIKKNKDNITPYDSRKEEL